MTLEVKRSRHVAEVEKAMLALPSGPLVEDDVGVEICRYLYYGERPYVENVCALPAETLASWKGRYMVHDDAICWNRAILQANISYMNWDESPFWTKEAIWERRTSSVLGNFVPYHRSCLCVLLEPSHDQLAVRIPPSYKNFEVLSIVDVDAMVPPYIFYDGGDAFVAESPPTN